MLGNNRLSELPDELFTGPALRRYLDYLLN